MTSQTAEDVPDCTEGCSGDHVHKWEIEPHAMNNDFDTFVCDDDMQALEALQLTAEKVWDSMSPGEERTITIRMNAVDVSCETCRDTGEIDQTLGGISTSDPHTPCPDCRPARGTSTRG